MEYAIRSLQLQREIVFVARHAGKRSRVGKNDGNQPVSWIEISVGMDDRGTNIIGAHPLCVGSKVTAKKPALAADHMTFRAFRLAKEQRLSPRGITREWKHFGAALQGPQIANQSGESGGCVRRKRWHASGSSSIGQDLEEFCIGLAHDFGAGHEVRSALAAVRVESMARRACGVKSPLGFEETGGARFGRGRTWPLL